MTDKREIRAASYVLASSIIGVILMRIVSYFLPIDSGDYGGYLLSSAVFSLPTQLIFFLTIPFCIFKFYGKRSVIGTFEYSSCKKFQPFFLIAVPLGIAVYCVTIFVSSAWTGILRFTGYTVPTASPDMPDVFMPMYFSAEICMTAILPAVCEEFCMRGGLLSAMKSRCNKFVCIVLFGAIFGLFHQNIRQVFYTSLFGAFAAFVTLETDSLYPAILMHFTNNFLSVYFKYASEYGFAGSGMFDVFGTIPAWGLAIVIIAVIFVAVALVMLMLYCRDKKELSNRKKRLSERQAAALAGKSVTSCSDIGQEIETVSERLTVRDFAVFIALGVVAFLTTVFTYVWGFLY